MRHRLRSLSQFLYSLIASRGFLYLALGFFGLSALWVATASLYPMAFDEDFHIGVIKIYAEYWFPFGLAPTPDMAQYGGVVADPSYLFHYLMSYPWRFLHSTLQLDETTAIVLLRILNIGLFITGLIIFWRTLRLAKLSAFASNLIIALCCLIPISPLLAGQVNYDNLLIVMSAASFFFAVRIITQLQKTNTLSLKYTWWLSIVILLGTATKYAFLPIGVGIIGTITILVLLSTKRQRIISNLAQEGKALRWPTRLLLLVILCTAILLNIRYINNVITYHDVAPRCDDLFSQQACMAYGPYSRNTELKNELDPAFTPKSLVLYTVEDWIPGMTFRLFFAVAGSTNDFDTKKPVFLPAILYSIGIMLAVVFFILRARRLLSNKPTTWLFIGVVLFYTIALLIDVYGGYRTTGEPVAINGRYLIPLAPIIGALCVQSLQHRTKLAKESVTFIPLVAALLLLAITLQGGGIGTYLVRADADWFWSGWGQQSYQLLHDSLAPVTVKDI